MKHIKLFEQFINESTIQDFIKDVKNHDDMLSSGAYEKDGNIVVYLDGSDPDAEMKTILKLVRTKYKDKLKKVNDGSEDTITFKVLKECFHKSDGTPIGVDHLHRPIGYRPNIEESAMGDVYIMAQEAPNFATFKKEFVKDFGEVKGSKQERDLNTWLKSIWDERPTED